MPSILKVQCNGVQKRRQPQKDHVYAFSLCWSNGSETGIEKSHTAIADLRVFLKNYYYKERHDVQLPEIPAIKRFEIASASAKAEKRRKAMEEFCKALLTLPVISSKGNPVKEFFSNADYDETTGQYCNFDASQEQTRAFCSRGLAASNCQSDSGRAKQPKKAQETSRQFFGRKEDEEDSQGFIYAEVKKSTDFIPTNDEMKSSCSYVDIDFLASTDHLIESPSGSRSPRTLSKDAVPELYAEIDHNRPSKLSQSKETCGPRETQSSLNSSPWFIGMLGRSECQEILLEHGNERDFVVRESTNLGGQFALSVKHAGRVHHFPISLTDDKRYFIGQHRFKTVQNVISYYQKNDLFFDEEGVAIQLGSPLVLRP